MRSRWGEDGHLLLRVMNADNLPRRSLSFWMSDQTTNAAHAKPPNIRSRANARKMSRNAKESKRLI
jgi:hypothetical protein